MKMRKILFILATALLLAGGLLAGCRSGGPTVLEGPPILREDLMERTLFVRPYFHYYDDKVRTVDEKEFFDQVIDLCAGAEPFRPLSTGESTEIGPRSDLFYFRGVADEYVFSFRDAEEQMDIGFVHRDKPLLYIGKGSYDGVLSTEWEWFYTLPASNYAALHNLIQTYGGGEEIGEMQRWEWEREWWPPSEGFLTV